MISYKLTSRVALAFTCVALLTTFGEAQTVVITGGKVYPVSGPAIENGTVVITNGRITAVGANVPIPAGARRKDNIAAAFTVWEGLNPNSVMLAPARKEGITSFVIIPTGGLVSGQAAIVDVVPGTTTDMIIRAPVAMVAEIGDPLSVGMSSRGELIVKLRKLLEDTKFFQTHRNAFDRAETRPFAASRLDLQAMIPVIEGKMPMIVTVDRASDIDAAMRLARDYRVKLIIGGGAEAWMM